ncbi:MAG: class I SAM-dependent methyltransferase [Rhodobacteraceae bacterium]|nr:class I SAM-dependent methyltransferase [Paracoccaceae bacterium]
MGRLLRSVYVWLFRVLRAVLRPLGFLRWLERRGTRRALWLRSLFAIYDADDLMHLDMAWWTFDALDAVERFLAGRDGARVFEYGSGASTLWLSRRAGKVVSVEHDADWMRIVEAKIAGAGNVRLSGVPSAGDGHIASAKSGFGGQYFDAYVRAIDAEDGEFDLIVIDGRAREACLEAAIPRLAPGGIILVDDTKRARYRAAIEASGLAFRRFDGLAVSLPVADSTTLLARDKAVLDAL